ncbi:DUF421 domain-containing protein [Marinobacter salicampi]|uniref:DUF421 domain-containing protein n=1 Tax=Marinobacter salicampi TaxID=435907 RepID=UPI00140D76D0|nr:YetF domain-containing protein [Marinobacter salicampi]
MEPVFFDGWNSLIRTVIVGFMAYWFLVVFLRISGKRTLAKMNAFDWVVTVALGSTLATILLSKDVALAQGALALALLIAMQFAVTWSSVRIPWLRRAVTGDPTLLLYQGALLHGALRKQRVSVNEVRAAVRSSGQASLDQVEAVVLETDGSFSVISGQTGSPSGASSLEGVGTSEAGNLADKPHKETICPTPLQ